MLATVIRRVALVAAVLVVAAACVSPLGVAAHMVLSQPSAAGGSAGLPAGNTNKCATYLTPPAGGGVQQVLAPQPAAPGTVRMVADVSIPHGGGSFDVRLLQSTRGGTGNMLFSQFENGTQFALLQGATYPNSPRPAHVIVAAWPQRLQAGARGWIEVAMRSTETRPYYQCVYWEAVGSTTTGSTTGLPPATSTGSGGSGAPSTPPSSPTGTTGSEPPEPTGTPSTPAVSASNDGAPPVGSTALSWPALLAAAVVFTAWAT